MGGTRHHTPDVVLLDIRMPILDGFVAAKAIKSLVPSVAIIILSTYTEEQFVAKARVIGAHGYVGKSHVSSHLIKAIEHVVAGKTFFTVGEA